jgi:2,4-dienoyl-CoA reductase (NADPH2)
MKKIKKLLEPGRIGALEIKNRVCMPALGLNFCNDHTMNDRWINFYEERARGGVGLVIVSSGLEYTGQKGYEQLPFVDQMGWIPSLGDDRYLPGWRQLAETLHRCGTKVGAQIVHVGKYAHSSVLGGEQPISPSPIKANLTVYGMPGEVPREMTKDDIETAIQNIASTVDRAKRAGLDTIEYNLCSGYLMREFLSPITNQRTDGYGGSLENRMRFVREVIECTQEKVGLDFPLTARLSADEFLPGGHTLQETRIVAQELERAGIKAISVVGGGHETSIPLSPMSVPRGAFVYLAQAIKEVVDIPVVASARINNPRLAEEILENGQADFVAIGRPLMADPEFVKKAQEGHADEIRPCIACNQGCFDIVFEWKPVFCLMNAQASWEKEREIKPATEKKRIMVIGGGPAGLETARVLATRGHTVSLYEKGEQLGGQINISSVPSGREEFANVIHYFSGQLSRLGVDVYLGEEVTPDRVDQEGPDAVVVATGAEPVTPSIPGIEGENVVNAWDVLSDEASVGKRVIVLGGGSVGCETAIHLARKGAVDAQSAVFLATAGACDKETALALTAKGKDVTIVEALPRLGRDFGKGNRWVFMQAIRSLGIKSLTGVEVEEITPQGMRVKNGDEELFLEADTIVVAASSMNSSRTGRERFTCLATPRPPAGPRTPSTRAFFWVASYRKTGLGRGGTTAHLPMKRDRVRLRGSESEGNRGRRAGTGGEGTTVLKFLP